MAKVASGFVAGLLKGFLLPAAAYPVGILCVGFQDKLSDKLLFIALPSYPEHPTAMLLLLFGRNRAVNI